MSRLVADILDLSRIEAGAIVPEARPFVLADIVSRVAERIERDRGGGPIDVRIDERIPPVLVDEVLVEQVLVNVLENALDHAPGATVRIEGSLEADGAMVRLVIDDDGPGVPAEAMDRIFEKFYRVPRTGEGSRRGSGIGLAVVHGMVQAMGGEVHARPGGRGGLAIVIDLPTAPSAPEQAAPVPAESAR
jgi:two-component system sensor histidine kinase KdpD